MFGVRFPTETVTGVVALALLEVWIAQSGPFSSLAVGYSFVTQKKKNITSSSSITIWDLLSILSIIISVGDGGGI